jgi:tripartite-type tricarboxylate transporter receptor subunit TctC
VTSSTVLLAPKNTDRKIVETIRQAVLKSLNSSDMATRMHAIGLDVGGETGEEAYQALMKVKEGWEKLIKGRNIKFGGGR